MEVALIDLWLPILLAAVFVFLLSSVLHMVLPIHKSDYARLPSEDKLMAAMREEGLKPGDYVFPCPGSMKEMSSPEMVAKYNAGPVGFLTVLPNGPMAIGRSLGQWFIYSIMVSTIAGYVAGQAGLAGGTGFLKVFQITGAAAFMAYGLSHVPNSIWKGNSWSMTVKFIFDGLVYSLATGAVFGWLWPGAA